MEEEEIITFPLEVQNGQSLIAYFQVNHLNFEIFVSWNCCTVL